MLSNGVVDGRWLLLLSLAGCGFEAVSGSADLAPATIADLAVDSAGADLAGTDLSDGPGPGDMSKGGVDAASFGGPFGALPVGYCCNSDYECRGRTCASVGGQKFCQEDCDRTSTCTAWGAALYCGGNYRCVPTSSGFACMDPAAFTLGTKPPGTCCDLDAKRSGSECIGGVCNGWNTSEQGTLVPLCTQGCKSGEACAPGWVCHYTHICVKDPPDEPYTCTP
jgi:hypothetical protein